VSLSVDMTDKPYAQCASKTNMTQYLWVGNSYKWWRMFFGNIPKVCLSESSNSYVGET